MALSVQDDGTCDRPASCCPQSASLMTITRFRELAAGPLPLAASTCCRSEGEQSGTHLLASTVEGFRNNGLDRVVAAHDPLH